MKKKERKRKVWRWRNRVSLWVVCAKIHAKIVSVVDANEREVSTEQCGVYHGGNK